MKKVTLTLITLLFIGSSFAQLNSREKQTSFLFNKNYTQIIFKKQSRSNESKFRRFSFEMPNYSNRRTFLDNSLSSYIDLSLNIGLGYEYRKQLDSSKFVFHHGPDFLTLVDYYSDMNYANFGTGFRYNLGLTYMLSDKISIGIENQSDFRISYSPSLNVLSSRLKIVNPFVALNIKF